MKPSERAWAFGGGFTCSRYTQEILARAFDAATADLRARLKDNVDHQTSYGATMSVQMDADGLAAYTPGDGE